MPTHEGRGTDNRENRQDRWKPAIQLDEEPTIVVREPDAAAKRAPQNNQLMSERGILSLKPDLRLEQRGQHGQDKPNKPDHRGNLADSSLNKPELGFRYTQRSGRNRCLRSQPIQVLRKVRPLHLGSARSFMSTWTPS